MTITSLSVQVKDSERVNLFIDGEFKCGVSYETVLKFGLKKGDDLDEKRLSEIIAEDQKKLVFSKALNYVSKTLKTKKQVKTYLLGKGFDEKTVYEAIDKLKEYGYIDDLEYAKRYIESASKNQGKRLVSYKLMAKGIKKEDIENAYSKSKVDAFNSALIVAEKYLRNKDITRENLSKAYRYLVGKGFSYEETERAISHFKGEDI